jgi:hypothetical protein
LRRCLALIRANGTSPQVSYKIRIIRKLPEFSHFRQIGIEGEDACDVVGSELKI